MPDKSVVVISLEGKERFEDILGRIGVLFEEDETVKVYAGVQDVAQRILSEVNVSEDKNEVPKDHVLVEAENIIHGQRRKDYGSAEESFQRIWDLWAPILNSGNLSGPEKVALCMIGLKVARYMKSRDRDSVVDIAGYAGCLAQIKGWENE